MQIIRIKFGKKNQSSNKGKKNVSKLDSKANNWIALGPRRYQSSDGLTILVGRNNKQNDQLTLKTAQKMTSGFTYKKRRAPMSLFNQPADLSPNEL